MFNRRELFRVKIVKLILSGKVEEALEALSSHYGVDVPGLKVGMPKGYSGKAGCYVSKTRTIHVLNGEKLRDPFVVLHEFYHHLRTQDGKHKGTEKNANKFALEFSQAFQNFQYRLFAP